MVWQEYSRFEPSPTREDQWQAHRSTAYIQRISQSSVSAIAAYRRRMVSHLRGLGDEVGYLSHRLLVVVEDEGEVIPPFALFAHFD